MFTRRRFMATATVFTTAAPQMLFAQTGGEDLTKLKNFELRRLLRQAQTEDEKQRIRAEMARRGDGKSGGQQAVEEQPVTGTTASRKASLTPEQQEELRSRMSGAATREERQRIRREYFESLGKDPVEAETAPVQQPAPSVSETPAIEETLPPDNKQLTEDERAQFRARMRAAQTAEERKQIRQEYLALVKKRAHERGKGAEQSGGKGKGGSGLQGTPKDEGETPLLLLPGKGKGKKK